VLVAAAVLSALLPGAGSAMENAMPNPRDGAAVQPAQYYAGKQIRMVIASGVGGGYDVFARFLARHLARHIPGNPTIISQNMPAASGLAATNSAYSIAPKDGTVILAT